MFVVYKWLKIFPMAESDTSLLKFESIIFDENLNLSHRNEIVVNDTSEPAGLIAKESERNDLLSDVSADFTIMCKSMCDNVQKSSNFISNTEIEKSSDVETSKDLGSLNSEHGSIISGTSISSTTSFKLRDVPLCDNDVLLKENNESQGCVTVADTFATNSVCGMVNDSSHDSIDSFNLLDANVCEYNNSIDGNKETVLMNGIAPNDLSTIKFKDTVICDTSTDSLCRPSSAEKSSENVLSNDLLSNNSPMPKFEITFPDSTSTELWDGINNDKSCPRNKSNLEHNGVITDKGKDLQQNSVYENLLKNNLDLGHSNDSGEIFCNLSTENSVQTKDDEFHDAAQFFEDPSSLNFLERANYAPSNCFIPRSSLYVSFDPLHAKSVSSVDCKLNDIVDVESEMSCKTPEGVNKHLINNSVRESIGNVLISFESPLVEKKTDFNDTLPSPKLFTEEEFHNAIKMAELKLQEAFLKRQHDLECDTEAKVKDIESKLKKMYEICNLSRETFSFFLESIVSKDSRIDLLEKENIKLKEDLKTSAEDLQSVESSFSDFHKRYEQSKSMLKVYAENEDKLKQQLENMKLTILEKEEMYKALQVKTEEVLEKANIEVANVKRVGDGQVTVLKAQLKKAEMKISNLENDIDHVKAQNTQLSTICDELMAKVSNG